LSSTYQVFNGPMATTAPVQKVTTGASTKTMLQIVPAVPIKVIAWGVSFDGSTAATPGYCELIDTGTVAGTVTAYAVADIAAYDDPNSPANTSGTSGTPLNLGTALSGYTATAEGTITSTRTLDAEMVAPTNQYLTQFPLGRSPGVIAGHVLRIRMTYAVAVNALAWVAIEC
jgi:hypothetical protein